MLHLLSVAGGRVGRACDKEGDRKQFEDFFFKFRVFLKNKIALGSFTNSKLLNTFFRHKINVNLTTTKNKFGLIKKLRT